MIRAETLEELFALATGLSSQPCRQDVESRWSPTRAARRFSALTPVKPAAWLCRRSLSRHRRACDHSSFCCRAEQSGRSHRLGNTPPVPSSHRDSVGADEVDALIVLYTSVTISDNSTIAGGIVTGIMAGRAAGAKRKPVLVVLDGGRRS